MVSTGRLGQADRFRAIRLNETEAPPHEPGQTGLEGLGVRPAQIGTEGAMEEPESRIGAPEIPDEATAVQEIADLSPDEAVAEISQLAGLTDEDRAAFEKEDALG